MSTLTIILLVYVILDIILDTTAIILLRRKGYSLKSIAFKIKELLTLKVPLQYDDEDMEEYNKECDGWDDWENEVEKESAEIIP